jgi:hypothetical protein
MRILCLSAQLPGHLDWGGYLPTATALQERGHTVLWASGAEVAELVRVAGVPFHALPETGWRWPPPPPLSPTLDMDPAALHQLRAERALDQWLAVERVKRAMPPLLELGQRFRPDLVLGEIFVSTAGLLAEALDVPFAVIGWPALMAKSAADVSPLVSEARTRLDQLLTHFQLTGRNWTPSGPPALRSSLLHLTYWGPTWYNGLALAPQTHHVGGRALPTHGSPPWPADEPAVLITLGTSFGHDPNFFIMAAHAAQDLGCLPILALGGQFTPTQTAALRQRLPATALVEETVPYAAVLPWVTAAIHHGGAGTTHALVTHAVPQIVVPHAAEQLHQAQGVVRSGVGRHLAAKAVTRAGLVATLAQLLPDLAPVRAKAQQLRDEFAELGGVERAATLIEDVIRKT